MKEIIEKRIAELKNEVVAQTFQLGQLEEEVKKYSGSIASRRGGIIELEKLLNGGKDTNK